MTALFDLRPGSITEEDEQISSTIEKMVRESEEALIAAHGKNCWAKFELRIPSEGASLTRAPNPYLHTPFLNERPAKSLRHAGAL